MTNKPDEPAAKEVTTWQLNALTEALGDLTLTVSDSLTIGRGSDNDVVLGSKQVSRNHAVLNVLNGELYIKDLGSSNGTFINDERIEADKSKHITVDDKVGFASFNFQVNIPLTGVDSQQPASNTVDESSTDIAETEPVVETPAVEEPVVEEPVAEEAAVNKPIIESTEAQEPVVKQTGVAEVLPDEPEPVAEEAEPVVAPVTTEKTETVTPTPEVKKDQDAVLATEEATVQQPTVSSEQDKTTTTPLQEEADPDVLRAKQAATAQLSGTANLGQPRDIGTEGNNALDQAINNPANAGNAPKKSSGSWFIWLFIAIIIIGIALWLFNMGS